jgi:hypothetical protein
MLCPSPLTPVRRPGIHCTGGWVGPRAGLDRQKILNRFSDWQKEKKKLLVLLQRNQKLIPPVIMKWK